MITNFQQIEKCIVNLPRLGVDCIICGETIELTPNEEASLYYGHSIGSKVCDKCKQAVLYIREKM
jgi:hypothetical protein